MTLLCNFQFGAVKVERHRVEKVIQRRSTCVRPDLSKLDTSRFDSPDFAKLNGGDVATCRELDSEDEELNYPSKEVRVHSGLERDFRYNLR